ncbi:MAG: replicative DNA helicase, partial [Rhodospirillales bacterium]|nr:replicative DNA helicase [Rhodospirillales bacterium]
MTVHATTPLTPELADADPRLSAFRTPPHNVDAEKALLGAIFANNRAYEAVSEFLRPEHFALGQNGGIYAACGKLIERGQIADPVTLKATFEQDESFADIGGAAYLAELMASAVTIINAGEYGRIIHDLYLKRQLIALGED